MNKEPAIDNDTSALLGRVGDRVRRARTIKGISRRVLSEISGVSPRYLAQLEAGIGNISITLLMRVAKALDHRLEWLVSDDDPVSSETWQLTEKFRAAGPDVRARLLAAFDAGTASKARAGRICLIGLRGAGKSTLGQRLGDALGVPFVELNAEIETMGQMPIAEIMALYGVDGYRKFEAAALANAVDRHDRMVLAVAGGIVSDRDVFETLLARCHTIWLQASPAEHMDRVRAQGDLRPMAGHPEAMAQLKRILEERRMSYARADASFDTSGLTIQSAEIELTKLVQARGYLD
ncbi:MAG: helix-turn-helix transcriptional regulator [Paracoccaceae bacterium]